MLFPVRVAVIRGGGDLATGVAYQLHRAGFPVIVLELEWPLAIRRKAAFAAAVFEDTVTVVGVRARTVDSAEQALSTSRTGDVPVFVSSGVPEFGEPISILVDARMAKRNLDTALDQAPLVIGLGPGFDAGVDCHAVIETMRGHRLGRVLWSGQAAADTGVPGDLAGATSDRVVRASTAGVVAWSAVIGDIVGVGAVLGAVGDNAVPAPISGVVRGLIAPGTQAPAGMKIADIDPRADPSACFEISDKARLVGAGALEAALTWLNTE